MLPLLPDLLGGRCCALPLLLFLLCSCAAPAAAAASCNTPSPLASAAAALLNCLLTDGCSFVDRLLP